MEGGDSAILDSTDHIRSVDKSRLLELIGGFPEQLLSALDKQIPQGKIDASAIQRIGIVGVCTTRVIATVLGSLMDQRGSVPIFSFNSFSLPRWVGSETLLIFVSFSGNTLQVLLCFEQALRRKLPCIVVTTGGSLKKRAREGKVPVIVILKEQPPNRTVLPYMLVPILRTAGSLGLLDTTSGEIADAAKNVRRRRDELDSAIPIKKNRAKQLAESCLGRTPLIYTEDTELGGVVLRWQYDFNENAKVLAYSSILPELSHNEIIGLQGNGAPESKAPLFLTTQKKESPGTERLWLTIRTLEEFGYRPVEIPIEGGTELERILYGILLGDYISVYLAVLRGVDPQAVELIDRIRVGEGPV